MCKLVTSFWGHVAALNIKKQIKIPGVNFSTSAPPSNSQNSLHFFILKTLPQPWFRCNFLSRVLRENSSQRYCLLFVPFRSIGTKDIKIVFLFLQSVSFLLLTLFFFFDAFSFFPDPEEYEKLGEVGRRFCFNDKKFLVE
jgi:hypothetical protein